MTIMSMRELTHASVKSLCELTQTSVNLCLSHADLTLARVFLEFQLGMSKMC